MSAPQGASPQTSAAGDKDARLGPWARRTHLTSRGSTICAKASPAA